MLRVSIKDSFVKQLSANLAGQQGAGLWYQREGLDPLDSQLVFSALFVLEALSKMLS